MSPNYRDRKVQKKQRRCEAIISNECNIESSETPTQYLCVLNAGLSTGLTEEQVLLSAGEHGSVRDLLMLPSKSYCFLNCATVEDATRIFEGMHNVACIGQHGAVVYLGYFKQLPVTEDLNVWAKPLPPGFLILPDFVTEEEEQALLEAVAQPSDANTGGKLKNRRVQHFGYEFLYGVNNVDAARPLAQGIPAACDMLWPRFAAASVDEGLQIDWTTPDQLTVNEYEPGHGIPQHVDTHSAFLDPILSLSLQGDVVMEFRRGAERLPVILMRRSLLIMSGETRYDWTHGITPRVYDVVPAEKGLLSTEKRTKRTSFTFRRLRRGPCNCDFPTLCDSRQQTAEAPHQSVEKINSVAVQLEQLNVHNVYEQIASHFSETRHTPWPQVCDFLASFAVGDVLLDVGCGNGKYLQCNPTLLNIGCDRSRGLLSVCAARSQQSFQCDCLQVPLRSASVDGCISIAVIHHLATAERRLAALREMARLLRHGGRALIYVWAKNQRNNCKKSSYLLQNKAINKHKSTADEQRQRTAQQLQTQSIECSLPIHTNRTEFLQQDVLVPWKLKNNEKVTNATDAETQPQTFLRYYHVFEEHELEQLVEQVDEVELVRSYYDQGNHCVIFQKK